MARQQKSSSSNQQGQAFPLVLIILAIGSVLVSGFLTSANTSLLTARVYSDPIPDIYAADAGIEDAIWGLQYGSLSEKLDESGGYLKYTLHEPVNDLSVTISLNGTATNIIASHDFNDNNWSGGAGWLSQWNRNGSTSLTTSRSPYEGTHHLQLQGKNAYVERSVDLTGMTDVHLQFYAKVRSFEGGDTMSCLVSSDYVDWKVVQTWDRSDSDETYYPVDIDLSSFEMSSEFWIAFDSGMSGNDDYFYVDYLSIIGTGGSVSIQAVAGEETTVAKVGLTGGTVSVLSWESSDMPLIGPPPVIIAGHDFNDNNWSGGTGWLSSWDHQGSTSLTTSRSPYEGTRHLQLRGSNAYVERSVDLTGRTEVHLKFYAKAYSFESADTMRCLVSSDYVDWKVVHTWVNGDDDNTYHPFDIDLSSFDMSSKFWIVFDSGMSGNGDYFYVDYLSIVGMDNS
ncbi:MAG: hypothetical protein JW762_14625 [Dehalococcoidales bacterium]|nr:hypothetical protein [Dehalococcoidales bacterium]